ncbi:MAG TPA: conjugative transposon protein TraM [Hanamia sp.]|nr:conjugative transposon protein TraM [Hanamia sp.]
MHKGKISPSALRKRKMLLVLPALVIPCITLAFWAMGGGGGKANESKSDEIKNSGLNLNLPDPKMKKEAILDKLGFYDKAEKDSLKLKEEMQTDPYYQQLGNQNPESSADLEKIVKGSADKFHQSSIADDKLNTSPNNTNTNQAEEKLMQKIAELNKVINQPTKVVTENDYSNNEDTQNDAKINGSMNHLESMMPINPTDDSDPELNKLSSMLDKIIDIQHPEKIKEEIKQQSLQHKTNVFTVSKSIDDTTVHGFYSMDDANQKTKSNAIEAVVNETQVLVNGAVIKLRLLNNIYINDAMIPAGNFVFGMVSLDGERLNVAINSIRSGNSIYPVKMEVYDMDGLPGIYIPGAITRDAIKQSAENNMQTMQLTSLDPSLAAQATAAGIGTVKNLLSKKVKLVKVIVKAGYKILLKDKSVQQ